MDALCDQCEKTYPMDETQTCVCGAQVCDRCMETTHYTCADQVSEENQ